MAEGFKYKVDEVFQDGVVDLHREIHRLVEGPAVFRRDDGVVVLTRRAEIVETTARRDVQSMSAYQAENTSMMATGRPLIPLMVDGAIHTQYRKLLDPLFAPKVIAQLRDRMRDLSNELIDGFIADGRVELYEAFCMPLPSRIFLSLLGLPLEDLPFLLWFKEGMLRPPDGEYSKEVAKKMIDYLTTEMDKRDAAGDPGDDLIGGFLTAEVDGHRLTHEDVIDITILLVLAGLDTVASSLSLMIDWFARNPDRRKEVVENPALWPAGIEELLRVQTAVVAGGRFATAPFEIGGVQVEAGDSLQMMWCSANLDDDVFEHPLEVDFHRGSNRHIAFASGVHRCLGSHLARVEIAVALTTFHDRIADYHLDPDIEPGYRNVGVRCVDPLPLVFTPKP